MHNLLIFICIIALHCSKVWSNEAEDISDKYPKSFRTSPSVRTYIGMSVLDQGEGMPAARYKRTVRNCQFPTVTEDSDIFCKIYPSRVICNQTCMFGYTLRDGRMRTMRCNYEDDEWLPVRKFEKCKPFVDCTVSLGPGGKMICRNHYMNHGPICEISCQHYEDKDAVPEQVYKCDIHGKWTPSLPFCASPGTDDLDLVPPPPDVK